MKTPDAPSPFRALAATVVISPSGPRAYPDIALQWRPSHREVTTAKSRTRVYVPDRFFRHLQSKGMGSAASLRYEPGQNGRSLQAFPKGDRPASAGATHVVVRVLVRAKRCRLTRVLARRGEDCPVERLDREELFVAPIGSTIALALSDGRTQVVSLNENGPKLERIIGHEPGEWVAAAEPDRSRPPASRPPHRPTAERRGKQRQPFVRRPAHARR
jgi:hypothetical protein